jgi:hypothetical protein
VLLVRLRGRDGTVPSDAEVVLRADATAGSRARVDAAGEARFADLPAGGYEVHVDPMSLPAGWLAPWKQEDICFPPGAMPGFGAVAVTLALDEQDEVVVEIPLARPATIHGFVRGPDGAPLGGADVYASSLDFSSVQHLVSSDPDGYYEVVDVHPGTYRLTLVFAPDDPSYWLAQPPPVEVVVQSGALVNVDLRLATGPLTLRGRVVDQDGALVPEVVVLAYYHRAEDEVAAGARQYNWGAQCALAVTDANGRYRLDGVHAAGIGVQVAPDGFISVEGEPPLELVGFVPPIYVDLRGRAGDVDLGQVTAVRSRPFRMSGVLRLDDAWAQERRARLRHVRMTVYLDDPSLPAPNRDRHRTIDVDVGRDGRFEWVCEGVGQELVWIRLTYRGGPVVDRVQLVTPGGALPDAEMRYPR